jgi:3-dehydroquinate synthase
MGADATVRVDLRGQADHGYEIRIGRGLLPRAAAELAANPRGRRYALVCDGNTGPLYGRDFLQALHAAGADAVLLEVAAGEGSKDLATFGSLLERLRGQGFTRADCVLALGGGVVGDLAGFAAGCYMRGIPHVQLPTTLLSQVDSSVGGKTAINVGQGKNYCGLFHQPAAVYIDVDCLATLPAAEYLSGLGEVLKYGVIHKAGLFDFLEQERDAVLARDPEVLVPLVTRCCRAKAGVVEADEREGGLRRVLNYGHTVGHAVEALHGYGLPHGVCVAYGMRAAARLAHELGLLDAASLARHQALLDAYGLAQEPLDCLDVDAALELMRGDKKAARGNLVFVLPEAMGRVRVVEDPDPGAVRRAVASLQGAA